MEYPLPPLWLYSNIFVWQPSGTFGELLEYAGDIVDTGEKVRWVQKNDAFAVKESAVRQQSFVIEQRSDR